MEQRPVAFATFRARVSCRDPTAAYEMPLQM